ncbi:DNA binding protein [Fragilaria crotonensis]|nr:DNA binding protein [Fragilaria crotonensis]
MNSHRRSTSWDDAHGLQVQPAPVPNQWAQRFPVPTSLGGQGDAWNSSGQARVASFRTDQQPIDSNNAHYNYMPHADVWRQQQQHQQQQRRTAEYNQYYVGHMSHLPPTGQYHPTAARRPGSPTASPRNRPNIRPIPIRQVGPSQVPAGSPAGSSPSANQPRSSSEVLKTLLRKKACLYEPDTSKAVALVSWLVGRELALEYGYFSRQQLQSGVHACVATKIDAGAITRTKVNRCMQIILNSCFHYIIPRSDGTEENGDSFRQLFAKTAQDDRALLATLHEPWTDVTVDKNVVLHASLAEEGGVVKKGGVWGSHNSLPDFRVRMHLLRLMTWMAMIIIPSDLYCFASMRTFGRQKMPSVVTTSLFETLRMRLNCN